MDRIEGWMAALPLDLFPEDREHDDTSQTWLLRNVLDEKDAARGTAFANDDYFGEDTSSQSDHSDLSLTEVIQETERLVLDGRQWDRIMERRSAWPLPGGEVPLIFPSDRMEALIKKLTEKLKDIDRLISFPDVKLLEWRSTLTQLRNPLNELKWILTSMMETDDNSVNATFFQDLVVKVVDVLDVALDLDHV